MWSQTFPDVHSTVEIFIAAAYNPSVLAAFCIFSDLFAKRLTSRQSLENVRAPVEFKIRLCGFV